MSKSDAAELGWWRSTFSSRFPSGSLPRPGSVLVGKRFRLVDETEARVKVARSRKK